MLDSFWRTHPFVRILIPYIVGISCFDDPFLFAILLSSFFALYLLLKNNLLRTSFLLFVALMGIGSLQGILNRPKLFHENVSGTLEVKEIRKHHQSILHVRFNRNDKVEECSVLANWNVDTSFTEYSFSGKLSPHPSCANLPRNEWSYLNQKGVYHSLTLDSLQASTQEVFDANRTHPWIEPSKKYLSPDEIAMVYALLIGNTSHLESEVKSQYRNLGISHLLAVSGMHVGLLVLLLQPILNLLFFNKAKRLSVIILILLLWGYCHLCQNAPSIVRACYMFSVLQVGNLLKKKTSVINLLAFSAFSLLIFQPECIHDWGFILSHLAVFGLSLFQKTNFQLLHQARPWKRYLVNTILTSLQAQWITSSFLLYQTHLFPTYFLIANLILIPLSTIVLYVSILGIILSHFLHFPPFFACWKWLLHGMSYTVDTLNQLPHPQSLVHHFCWFETILVLGIGCLFWQLINGKLQSFLLLSLLLCNLLFVHLNLFFTLHPKEIHLFTIQEQRHLIYTNGLESIELPFASDHQRFTLDKGKNQLKPPN